MLQPRDLGHRLDEIERRLDDMRAGQSSISADGVDAFLRTGDFIVKGGTIRVTDNGDIIIDGGQLVAGPTTVDASGVVIGPTTLNSSGLTVGSNVLVDSDGLHVDEGLVRAVDSGTFGVNGGSFTLGTSWHNWGTITIPVPSWANRLHYFGVYRSRVTMGSGTPILSVATTVNDSNPPAGAANFIHLAPESRSLTEPTRENIPNPGSSVVVRFWAILGSGSTTNHSFVANLQWTALRD